MRRAFQTGGLKAAPEHRVNPANPNVDIVSFGLRIVFHDAAQPIRWTTPRPFLAPGLKCSPHRDASSLGRCLVSVPRGDFVANGFIKPTHRWKAQTLIFAAAEGFTPN